VLVEGHSAYHELAARLEGPGSVVRDWTGLRAQNDILRLVIPAQRLVPGPHTLILEGRERADGPLAEIDRWQLVIEKK
jgi:hypothetical protein